MTEKIKPSENWSFKNKINEIVTKNCKEIPYEGTEVDKTAIIEQICELLSSKEYSLLKHTRDKPRKL